MKQILTFFLSATALLLVQSSKAQSSQVQVIDLNALQQSQSDTSQVSFRVYFKVSPAAQADSAFFLFGTSAGNASVLTAKAGFVSDGDGYALRYNSNNVAVRSYATYADITISKTQYNSSKYITLYLKDKSGYNTAQLNTKIKE